MKKSASMPEYKRVWSLYIRCFHWMLVILFIVSFLSGENELHDIHTYSGYAIALLVLARIIRGCVGTGYASFVDFVYSPGRVLNYCKLLIRGKAPRYFGHNPLGGAMVIVMLMLLTLIVVSGLTIFGINEHSGPLYFLAYLSSANQLADFFEGIHELSVYAMLGAIGLHVSGVIFSSLYHKENLVKSMVTGNKEIDHS